MTKVSEKDKELARELFLAGKEQKEIASFIGVSEQTISKWSTAGGWREMRAAKQVTRPELVNKLLLAINKLIEQVNTSEDPQYVAQLSDKLSKLSTTIERLDRKTNVTTFIETFIAFGKWLEYRSQTDSALTPELLKTINKYQDLFIAEKIGASR